MAKYQEGQKQCHATNHWNCWVLISSPRKCWYCGEKIIYYRCTTNRKGVAFDPQHLADFEKGVHNCQ